MYYFSFGEEICQEIIVADRYGGCCGTTDACWVQCLVVKRCMNCVSLCNWPKQKDAGSVSSALKIYILVASLLPYGSKFCCFKWKHTKFISGFKNRVFVKIVQPSGIRFWDFQVRHEVLQRPTLWVFGFQDIKTSSARWCMHRINIAGNCRFIFFKVHKTT